MSGPAGTEIKTKAGIPVTPAQEQFARSGVALLGLMPADANFDMALDAGRRGWPAWRIAQHLRLDAQLIAELGGPPA